MVARIGRRVAAGAPPAQPEAFREAFELARRTGGGPAGRGSSNNVRRAAGRSGSRPGEARNGVGSAVEGAADAVGAAVEDVGVEHRGGPVTVARQLLMERTSSADSRSWVAKLWQRRVGMTVS
jgi:hypothetical protein